MTLIPWRKRDDGRNAFYELEKLHNQMDRLFDFSFFQWPVRVADLFGGTYGPALDVVESDDALIVKADLPGMEKEKIEVSVHENTLKIKGVKQQEQHNKEKGCVCSERYYGSFNRAITLPVEVDAGKVNARYKNGVLEITLPKKEEAKAKQRKIEIE